MVGPPSPIISNKVVMVSSVTGGLPKTIKGRSECDIRPDGIVVQVGFWEHYDVSVDRFVVLVQEEIWGNRQLKLFHPS